MKTTLSRTLFATGAALFLLTAGYVIPARAAETIPVGQLAQHTHVHGLAVDPQDPSRLLIATHHGLFRAGPDGTAERISAVQDFMGFNPHPSDPGTLFASGHPAEGGNLGFITSTDEGKTWKQVSPGAGGPVDFHQMTVSPADPNTIYGAYRGLQVSRDAGKNWEVIGPTPDRLIDLAASAKDVDTLYAATESGLFISTDGGKTWKALLEGAPVSLVEVTPEGSLYAFVLERGLVKANEPPVTLTDLSNTFGQDYLLHLAADPTNPNRLFAATGSGQVVTSMDGGRTWTAFSSS